MPRLPRVFIVPLVFCAGCTGTSLSTPAFPAAQPTASAAPTFAPSASPASPATAVPTVAPSATPRVSDSALCTGWTMRLLATGLGDLESVLPDPNGNGVLVSSTTNNAVERIDALGNATTVAAMHAPGQLVAYRGNTVLVTTGDSTADGLQMLTNGMLVNLDPATGATATYASGLSMPNGLVLDAAGNAYVTNDVGNTGVTKIPVAAPAQIQTSWSPITDSNGIAIDAASRTMYVAQTFTASSDIMELSLDAPQSPTTLISLSSYGNTTATKGLDDLILDTAGILDVPANISGEIFRVDPATKYACLLAKNVTDASAVAEETAAPHGLISVGFDGSVYEFVPPSPLP